MAQQSPAQRSTRTEAIWLLAAMIALMWASEGVDSLAHHSLDDYGIQPRDGEGLIGIVTAPFLHAGFGHLISNTIPLAVTGVGIALAGLARIVRVTVIVGLVAGVGTWVTAPAHSVTIGASGIVFGFAAYLISRGVFTRRVMDLGLGVLVIVLYGGALLGSLAPHEGISWQNHLFGAIGGVVAARFATTMPKGRASSQSVVRAR